MAKAEVRGEWAVVLVALAEKVVEAQAAAREVAARVAAMVEAATVGGGRRGSNATRAANGKGRVELKAQNRRGVLQGFRGDKSFWNCRDMHLKLHHGAEVATAAAGLRPFNCGSADMRDGNTKEHRQHSPTAELHRGDVGHPIGGHRGAHQEGGAPDRVQRLSWLKGRMRRRWRGRRGWRRRRWWRRGRWQRRG